MAGTPSAVISLRILRTCVCMYIIVVWPCSVYEHMQVLRETSDTAVTCNNSIATQIEELNCLNQNYTKLCINSLCLIIPTAVILYKIIYSAECCKYPVSPQHMHIQSVTHAQANSIRMCMHGTACIQYNM